MTTIKLKNGSGAPTSGDLAQGEPALDLTNKRLYTEDSGGTVIEVGTNPGVDVTFADNRKAIFGAGSDLQIYHDGSNSYIDDTGTGSLIIRAADNLEFQKYTGETYITAAADGAVDIYYNDAIRLATTSTGIDVTGTVTADGGVIENSSGATLNVNTNSGATDSKILLHEGTTASPANGASIRYDGANNIFKIGVGYSVDTTRLTIDRNTGDISFYEDTGTTAKLFWDASAESLGIGTSSIDLTSSGRTVVQVEGSSNALLNLTDGTSRLYLHQKGGTSGADIWNSADSYMRFATNDTERMRIDASGNVGIGTSSPESQLQVNVGTNLNLGINEDSSTVRLSAYNDAANANVPMTINSSSTRFDISGSEAIRIDSSGNLLVGRSSTGAAATDNGHIFYGTGQHYIFSNATECVRFYETSGSGQQVGSISITSSATTFNTSSDQRLKENIADADDAGSKVDAIQVRKFDWIADGSHQDYGMVAQELQTVAPEAVSGDADSEDMMGVDYSKLVPMMLKEIQSLRARVAQLEGAN